MNINEQREVPIDKSKDKSSIIKQFKSQVEEELFSLCRQILDLLDTYLIPNTDDSQAIVFYLRMKGDYYKHIFEFATDYEKQEASEKSIESYQQAYDFSVKQLEATNPIRLGLALSLSVFYYESLK